MHLTQTIYLTKSKYKDFNSQLDQLTLISKNLKNQANFLLKQASSYHYYQKEIKRFQNLIQYLNLNNNKTDKISKKHKINKKEVPPIEREEITLILEGADLMPDLVKPASKKTLL